MKRGVGDACRSWHGGHITFDQFASETRGYWIARAKHLIYRWGSGRGVDVQDLVQIMLTEAWLASLRYDGRSPFASFVIWCALNAGRHAMAKARDIQLYPDELPDGLETRVIRPTDDADVRMQVDREITSSINPTKTYALTALRLVGFDTELAGDALFEDTFCRISMKIKNRHHAKQLVHDAATQALAG